MPKGKAVNFNLISQGNTKLGTSPNFSIPAGVTCPAASDWCAAVCYAKTGRYPTATVSGSHQYSYDQSFEPDFVDRMVKAIAKTRQAEFRIHAGGDFYSAEYIAKWVEIARRVPGIKFWAYTRSWNIAELLPALEVLRAVPNVQLFASFDSTMPMPPRTWRQAGEAGDSRAGRFICPVQTGAKASCKECKYCFVGFRGDVTFQAHSSNKNKA